MQYLQIMSRQFWEKCKMILPNKIKLNQAKAQETKAQIDEGLAIARKIDAMRELKVTQETNIKQWRDVTVKAVQDEINEILSQRDTLRSEIAVATERRDELRKPLDFEWIKLNEEKSKFEKDRDTLNLNIISFDIEVKSFEKEKVKINKAILNAEQNEEDTKKLKEKAQELKEVAQLESNLAKQERENSNKIIERKIAEVNQSATEYEVGLQTIKLREQQVKEKEEELITRENDLARRINNLQRAEAIK
jgi:uncharacterized phage infection (PIP) family protein YhgE